MNKKQFVLHQKHVCVSSPHTSLHTLSYQRINTTVFQSPTKKWTSSSTNSYFLQKSTTSIPRLAMFFRGLPSSKRPSFWGPSLPPLQPLAWLDFQPVRSRSWRDPLVQFQVSDGSPLPLLEVSTTEGTLAVETYGPRWPNEGLALGKIGDFLGGLFSCWQFHVWSMSWMIDFRLHKIVLYSVCNPVEHARWILHVILF